MSQTVQKAKLGDRLLEQGAINKNQLDVALGEQRRAYRPLGEILVSLGFVREEDIARILAGDLGLPFLRAVEIEPDPVLVAAIDGDFVRNTGSFPIRLDNGSLCVAMTDPSNPERVSAVRGRFPYPLQLSVTTEGDLATLMRAHFSRREGRLAKLFETIQIEGGADATKLPVEKITEALLLDGIHRGATDIHVEPEENLTRVRFRVDGILSQAENLPKEASDAVVSRIKVLSDMDIAERRRPQDGRLRIVEEGRAIDMRVSVMPCADGENIVMRILDKSGVSLRLPQLGIRPEHQRLLAKIGDRSHGLFLVTGPTGSGKTTTLYALLSTVDSMHRNVCTIEDPIEYRLPLLRQSQVDPAIGFGFKEGLRSLLRQDPDVILVGEIRDQETANMAIKASMTGHLVFSTLHTNSAIGALPRLIDLGIEPYLVEDALIGVFAQRLVRKVCAYCAKPYEPTRRELEFLQGDKGKSRKGSGCLRCGTRGYSGRSAISELFLPTDDMAEVLREGADMPTLRRLADEAGFKSMTDCGRDLVREGVTTVEEIERVNKSHRLSKDEREDL